MRILIVNPPFYRLQGASLIHYPAGCCSVAAVLEEAGYDSSIYNSDYDPNKKTILGNTNHINVRALTALHEEYNKRLHADDDPVWMEIRDHIARYKPEILMISVFNTTMTAGTKIAAIAKELDPDVLTIFEGCSNRGLHCAVDPARNGDFSVMDFAIRKEPEETIVELIKAIDAKSFDFSRIKGLSWKRPNGDVIHNEDRPFIEDLDRLPFPARHRLECHEKIPPPIVFREFMVQEDVRLTAYSAAAISAWDISRAYVRQRT